MDTDLDEIVEIDAWGNSVIDGIWRGGNCFLQFNSEEAAAGSLGAYWPYGAFGALVDGSVPIGPLASVVAKAMVLTVTAGTPAQTTTTGVVITTLTATMALLAKNFNAKLLFNSKLLEVSVRLRCYPYLSGTKTVFFSTT